MQSRQSRRRSRRLRERLPRCDTSELAQSQRAARVESPSAKLRDGRLNDRQFGCRMKGAGLRADQMTAGSSTNVISPPVTHLGCPRFVFAVVAWRIWPKESPRPLSLASTPSSDFVPVNANRDAVLSISYSKVSPGLICSALRISLGIVVCPLFVTVECNIPIPFVGRSALHLNSAYFTAIGKSSRTIGIQKVSNCGIGHLRVGKLNDAQFGRGMKGTGLRGIKSTPPSKPSRAATASTANSRRSTFASSARHELTENKVKVPAGSVPSQ